MKEKQRKDKPAPGGNGDSIFDGVPDLPENKNVAVASGPYAENLPIAGMSVGEVRRRFADRFDIDPQAQAIVDGNSVDDDVALKAGQSLMFIRHAGEKGAKVVLVGDKASAETGAMNREMPIPKLLERMLPGPNTGHSILPPGIRAILSRGPITVWAWEMAPHIRQLSWIRSDSPRPYGPGTKYRKVRIALPYLVILAPFGRDGAGMPQLLLRDECFFRTKPLQSLDDELSYPGLLNCSKYREQDGNPLSWICTQHLKPNDDMDSDDPGQRFRAQFEAVRYCLLETSFNLSSEHHEGNSWYGQSKKVDPRIATIEDWEENTKKDPLFVLDVPWIKTGFSLKQVAGRMFQHAGAADQTIKTADDVARLIFNG